MEVANGCYCTSLVPGVSQTFAGSRNTQADSAALRCGLAGIATSDDLRTGFESGILLTLPPISFRTDGARHSELMGSYSLRHFRGAR